MKPLTGDATQLPGRGDIRLAGRRHQDEHPTLEISDRTDRVTLELGVLARTLLGLAREIRSTFRLGAPGFFELAFSFGNRRHDDVDIAERVPPRTT